MRTFMALLSLISATALAGSNGTSFDNKLMESSSCITDTDCKEFLALPDVTAAACRKVSTTKSKCLIRFATCPAITDHVGKYNKVTKACEYKLVMPELGITCYSGNDCGMAGALSQVNDTMITFMNTCVLFEGKSFGICRGEVTDATCCAWGMDDTGMCLPQTKYCFSNVDCYADEQVCHNNQCQTPSFSQEVGSGNVCNTNNDCGGNMISWGKLCIPTLFNSSTGNLCQECKQGSAFNGVDAGCTQERPYCKWGPSWNDPLTAAKRSVYLCSTN